MTSWILLAAIVIAQAALTSVLYLWAARQPSDNFGAGVLFWLWVLVSVVVDVVWLAINLLEVAMNRAWH